MTTDVAIFEPPSQVGYTAAVEQVLCRPDCGPVQVTRYRPHENDLPSEQTHDAVIVTGSNSHVSDRTGWMDATMETLTQQLHSGTPVLGVCFGHQLLADMLGGEVRTLSERKAGFTPIELTETGRDSRLLSGIQETFSAFAWHRDIVADLPNGVDVLARNSAGVQAFQSTTLPAYGVQFHPEYTRTFITALLGAVRTPRIRERILSTCIAANEDSGVRSRLVYANFVNSVATARQ